METGGNDFVLETKGRCFLCLKNAPATLFSWPKIINSDSETKPNLSTIYDLQCLSRYLSIDMRKVFLEDESIPLHLLEKVQRSRLKAELCEDCNFINKKMSALNNQLEKIKLEMLSWSQLILDKLEKGGDLEKTDDIIRNVDTFDKAKLEIMKCLRKEALQKCSQKVKTSAPRLPVQNLTTKEINQEILKRRRKNILDKRAHLDSDPQIMKETIGMQIEIEAEGNNPSFFNSSWDCNYNDSLGSLHSETPASTENAVNFNNNQLKMEAGVLSNESLSFPSSRKRVRISSDELNDKCTINPNTGKHKCTTCEKDFSSRCGWLRHYKGVHVGAKLHKCPDCNSFFKRQEYLKVHRMSVHFGKRFTCTFCSKSSTQARARDLHKKTCKERPATATETTTKQQP